MSAFGQSRHDERSKRSNDFCRPERARISWGKAMRGRGPGEGPNLLALGVTAPRCALLEQVQPGMRVQTWPIAAPRSGPCRFCVRHTGADETLQSNTGVSALTVLPKCRFLACQWIETGSTWRPAADLTPSLFGLVI